MDHSASVGTKDLARRRRRRSCTPPRFSSTLLALAGSENRRKQTGVDDRTQKRQFADIMRSCAENARLCWGSENCCKHSLPSS
jgi:hypothetical protein